MLPQIHHCRIRHREVPQALGSHRRVAVVIASRKDGRGSLASVRLLAPLVLACVLLSGCSAPPKPAAGAALSGATPRSSLYDQVRSGSLQMGQAQDVLSEAYQLAKSLPKMSGESKDAILETVDAVGRDASKYAEDPPPREEFDKNPQRRRKELQSAIIFARDSIKDLNDLRGEIFSMQGQARAQALKDRLAKLDALIEQAIEALFGAIKAYAGTEDGPAVKP